LDQGKRKGSLQRLGGNFEEEGAGAMRKIADEDLKELERIFEVTQALSRFDTIEKFSAAKAKSMGYNLTEKIDDPYFRMVYTANSGKHKKSRL